MHVVLFRMRHIIGGGSIIDNLLPRPQSPQSFSTHERKDGEPGKTCHVRDIR